MKLSLARSISFCAGKLTPLLSTSKPNPHHISPLRIPLSSLNFPRFFSDEISKPSESNLGQSPNLVDAEDNLSNEELKKQIKKMYDGDADAFASVFETILKRKLSGKSDKLDEEFVNELPEIPEEGDESDGESDSELTSDEDKLC